MIWLALEHFAVGQRIRWTATDNHAHFDRFMAAYPRDYQSCYVMLRGLIPEVADKFMGCGDLAKGFVCVLRRVQLFDRTSLFQCRGSAPDKFTAKRRFRAFHVAPFHVTPRC